MPPILRTLSFLFLLLVSVAAEAQTAGFTMSASTGCSPQVIYFTNTSTGSITAYSWNFGNGGSSVLKDPSTTYTSPGTYTITLNVSFSGGATATTTSNVTIYPKPTVSFTVGSAIGCKPHSAVFSTSVTPNAPGAVAYLWNFGDGSTDTAANPTHIYTISGTFGVSLTVTSGAGCQTTVTQPAFVQVLGSNPFTASPLNSCSAPVNVNFSTGSLSGVTTTWDFGDGSTGSGNGVSHTYAASGSYTVMMIQNFTNVGCSDTVTRPAYVNVRGRTATFSGPTNICVNSLASFQNGAAPASGYWNFGDGQTAYGITAQHAYATAGTYTVRMVTIISGCPDTAFKILTVNPRPNPVIIMTPSLPCPPPVPITFTVPGMPAGCTYNWTWASGGTSTSAAATKTYTIPYQRDTISVLVTTPAGCTGAALLDSIEMHDILLYKKVIPKEGCIPLPVSFGNVHLETTYPDSASYPSPIASYTWNFGDGSPTSAAAGTTHTYTTFGAYVGSITVTTGNGCTITDTFHINAGTRIPPSYNILKDSNCIADGQLLQNTTSPPAPLYSWSSVPGGQKPWLPHSPTVLSKILAEDSLRLYLVSYNNGCKDTFSRMVKVIGSGAFYTYEIQCPPSLDVLFRNMQVGSTSMLWDFGDGTTSTSMAYGVIHTYPAIGTYTCTQSTFDSKTGCVDTFRQTFTLTAPKTSFYASDTTLCKGDRVLLVGSFSGVCIGYMWAIDNIRVKRKDTVRHLQLSNLTPGYHNTTLYCKYQTYGTDTLTCIDSIRKSNYLFVSNPIASFSAIPPSGCSPLPVSFTSLSSFTPGAGFVKLKWDYGDGGKDSGLINPVSHTYTKAGVYNVMLTALDSNGCTSSIVQPNLINTRKIVAGFGVNKTTACAGEVLQFYGNLSFGGYPLKYYWHFGDGDTSTLETPTHAYAAVGSYTVQLIATDSATGCADTLTRIAYINIARPHASFTLSDTFSICPPLIVNFNSTSTGASTYAWSFGDGNSSPLANPTNTYGAPGLFYVTLIVKNAAGCADTSSATLVRVLGYAGALTYKPLIGCAPLTVNFRALVTNAPSLLWDYSDGVTMPAHGDTISHVYLTPGKYVPKLIFSNNAGCISSSVGLDTIKVDEVTGGFTMSPPCERSFITFTDTSSGALVKPTLSVWTFDSANVKTGNPVNWRYPAPGEYDVTLVTANWNNCRDTITKHFTVQPLPVVKASDDTSICVPDNAMLSVTGALTYVWTPGISLNCANCSNPVAAPTISTGYVVFGTDSNGCVNSDTVVVNIQSKTTFSTMDSGEVCLGQAFQLHASGAVSFHWTPDSTIDHPDIADPLARPKKTTTYFVIAKEGSCAADTQKVRVRVNPLPFVDAGKDETAIAGNPVQLQASGNNIHHLVWSPDSLLDCTTCYGPIAHPMMTTTFYVTAYTEKGCPATDSVTIHVLCDGSQLFVPNTFTPNGDGKNDYFFPRGVGINEVELLRVYDRWGELLFERQHFGLNEEYAGWDGTAKGKLLPPDVYVYMLVAPCGASERITLKGDITLMR